MRTKLIDVAGTLLLVIAGCLVGAMLIEAGFRIYLQYNYPNWFTIPEPNKDLSVSITFRIGSLTSSSDTFTHRAELLTCSIL